MALDQAGCRIPIYGRGLTVVTYALVDEADAALVAACRWNLHRGYAVRPIRNGGQRHELRMHRLILGLSFGDPRQCDHRNRDRLDNRRANLRVCTRAENNQNVTAGRGTSRFRGVSWNSERRIWRAQAQIGGRARFIGYYPSETDAAEAAAAFRRIHMPFSEEQAA